MQRYCDECVYLEPKEWDQTLIKTAHMCRLYNFQVMHKGQHPRIPTPDACSTGPVQALPTGALSHQVGNSDYKSLAVQPAELLIKNKVLWAEGEAIQHILRHRTRDGRKDLEKARHYIDMLLELEYSKTPKPEALHEAGVNESLHTGTFCNCQICQQIKENMKI